MPKAQVALPPGCGKHFCAASQRYALLRAFWPFGPKDVLRLTSFDASRQKTALLRSAPGAFGTWLRQALFRFVASFARELRTFGTSCQKSTGVKALFDQKPRQAPSAPGKVEARAVETFGGFWSFSGSKNPEFRDQVTAALFWGRFLVKNGGQKPRFGPFGPESVPF